MADLTPEQQEHLTRLLASGLNAAQLVRAVPEKLGVELTDAEFLAALALAMDTIAAAGSTDEAFSRGLAVTRLNDLYTRALAAADYKTCHAIQRELTRLTVPDTNGQPERPSWERTK